MGGRIRFRVFGVFRGSEKRDSCQSSSRYRNNRPRHICAPGDSTEDSIRGQTSKTRPLGASSTVEWIRSLRAASLGSAREHARENGRVHVHGRAHGYGHAHASGRLGPLSCSSFHCNNQPTRWYWRHGNRRQGLTAGRLEVPSSSTRQAKRTQR